MLPIAGVPLLAYTLRYLGRNGFDEIAINLHHQADVIRDHFGQSTPSGQRLHYFHEAELLGTAGTVKRLAEFFESAEDFLVVYGDLLVDQDLHPLVTAHRRQQAAATLVLHQRPGSNSLVEMDPSGRITAFIERPTENERSAAGYPWVNSGLQMISRSLVARMPDRVPADLPRDVYVPYVAVERFFGFPLQGYRCAIDSPERYAEAQAAVALGRYGAGGE